MKRVSAVLALVIFSFAPYPKQAHCPQTLLADEKVRRVLRPTQSLEKKALRMEMR